MKTRILAVVALLLAGCAVQESQFEKLREVAPQVQCIDHLGLAKYGDTFVRSHPDGFGVGVFTQKNLFGDPVPYLDRRIGKGGIPLVRYNLRWSDTHSFSPRDFPAIVAEAKRLVPLVNKYPGTRCEFSGATEHQLSGRDASDLARRVLAVVPARCVYVNNPQVGKGAFIVGTRIKNEVHGADARPPGIGGPFNFSFDGSGAFDSNVTAVKQRMRNAEVFFMWDPHLNGRRNASDTTPRPQRKFWPTPRLIRALAFLFTDQGPGVLPPRHLVKPVSDQHVVPPADRELKPVLLFPSKADRITIKVGNKVIATSERRQPYADGRGRYYLSSAYGYQIMQDGGTNVVDVYAGKKKVGTTNLGFRNTEFR